MTALSRPVGSFPRSNAGSAALEFAIIVPFLLGLIFTLVDLGRLMVTDSILQAGLGSLAFDQRHADPQGSPITEIAAQQKIQIFLSRKAENWIEQSNLTLSLVPRDTETGTFYFYQLRYRFIPIVPFAKYLIRDEFLVRHYQIGVLYDI